MYGFQDVIRALDSSTTRRHLISALHDATTLLGAEYFGMVTEVAGPSVDPWTVLISNAPDRFLHWYRDRYATSADPVVRQALRRVHPVFSDEAAECQNDPDVEEFLETARKHGIGFSLVAQQHAPRGISTVCSFWSRNPPVVEREFATRMAACVASHAHNAAGRVLERRSAIRNTTAVVLRDCERRCLELLSQGRRSRDIATLLQVPERTITYYIDRAMQKLGVHKPRAAVAKALARNEIHAADMRLRPWSCSDALVEVGSRPVLGDVDCGFDMTLREAQAAPTLEILGAAAARAVKALGFDHFCFIVRTPVLSELARQCVLTNYPAPVRTLAEDEREVRINPMIGGGTFKVLPFFWDDCQCCSAEERAALTSALSTADPATAWTGLTAMTFSTGGGQGVLCVAARHSVVREHRFEVARMTSYLLRVLHDRSLALTTHADARTAFTSRELACLDLVAGGFGFKQVAGLLNCSTRMARYRLKKLTARIGVRTLQEAVTVAIHHGHLRMRYGNGTELVRAGD